MRGSAPHIVVYDVLTGLARERPLLYVLEDLHFADSASLDLLWFVATRPSRVPMLFLLAQRLGQGAPEPRPSRTNFSQIVLEPLADEDAERIVEAALDWAPDELRDRIVARAGGNPFFIEESIRSLIESGAVARDAGGEWRMRDPAGAPEVPATLHAVIAPRVARLPPATSRQLPDIGLRSATACSAKPAARASRRRSTRSSPPTSSSRPRPASGARAATGSSTR